jgi:asparagine synthase (glutamine-hydrolysing)
MCGIAGVFLPNKENRLNTVKAMTDALIHRGPDGEGHWYSPTDGITLGHRRLSIIDLTANASQPMHYSDRRFTIVFNGEIYNYIELKQNLLKDGYTFNSDSDTEVLLALYDQKKEKLLSDLDGMFAFAIWDEKERKLFCARDRFGEKPFFYHYQKDKGFFFASEMKALWAAGVPREPDALMLEQFVKVNCCLHRSNQSFTFYKNINQIDSGHFLTISSTDFEPKITQYYSLDNVRVNNKIGFGDATEHFHFLLSESVKRRLRSDVPVGSSLSGGIDSSSLVLLMDQLKAENTIQKTFSARFKNYDKDEGFFMKLVTEKSNKIERFEVWPDKDEMEAEIDKIIYHQEEPFGSASIFSQWKVMELAKKNGVTVLLDGQGADEQLAGYLHYYNVYLAKLFQRNYSFFKREVNSYEKLRGIRHSLHPENQTIRIKLGRIKRTIFRNSISLADGHLSDCLRNDMMHTGLKELLRYADRNSMAHSVEVRLPFLDHQLVEFVFSLPDEFKLAEGWTKLLLRKSMEYTLPPQITWRIDKIAYEAPQQKWLATVRSKMADEIIYGYLNDSGVTISRNEVSSINEWNYFLLLKMYNQ